MKILITAATSSSEISGVQRHAFNMVRCLLRRPEISAVHLAVAPWQSSLVHGMKLGSHPRLITHVAEMGRTSLGKNVWYYRGLPKLAAQVAPDLVHLAYPVPVDRASLGCPTVVTLHDLYPYEIPRNFGFSQVIFNRLILQHCMRSVDAIACVSDTTLLRMRRYTGRAVWAKAVRIDNCVEPGPSPSLHSPVPSWRGEPFLLSVSQHRWNKNISLLIRTFHLLLLQGRLQTDARLVIVGITGPETSSIQRTILHYGLEGRVVCLHGLTDEELQWCYTQCDALVAPSTTEGFGLPVAEALLAGCRVVCSEIPTFREIGGEHCRFVALGRNEEARLADAIAESLKDPAKPPVPLPHLSCVYLAERYVHLYRDLVGSPSSQRTQAAGLLELPVPERKSL